MLQDRALTRRRMFELWTRDDIPTLAMERRPLAVLSDFHLGNGRGADDFRHNEETLSCALDHYNEHGYSLILLGDIEELWQFSISDILARYGDSAYAKLRALGEDRVHRVFGNHDIEWASMPDPLWDAPDRQAPEALKLTDGRGIPRILLVHGHQGSTESDRFGRISRVVVRAFRALEPLARTLGLYRNPVTATSRITKDYERIMHEWARENGLLLICGHSHRALFASRSWADRIRERMGQIEPRPEEGETHDMLERLRRELKDEVRKGRDIEPTEDGFPLPCYFNCGCALYGDGITALELVDREIRLVKWHRDPSVAPRREVYQQGSLTDFLSRIERAGSVVA